MKKGKKKVESFRGKVENNKKEIVIIWKTEIFLYWEFFFGYFTAMALQTEGTEPFQRDLTPSSLTILPRASNTFL